MAIYWIVFWDLNMWQRLLKLFRKQDQNDDLMTEFGESLLLLVDCEQLKNNLLSKIKELIDVEKAFVYLANQSGSPRVFSLVEQNNQTPTELPDLVTTNQLVQWFRINRQILLFHENEEVIRYLKSELAPFQDLSINLAFPLVSMDRLIGIVFLLLPQGPPNPPQLSFLQTLGRQAGLAFENALLFQERLQHNENMFRAEQLATMGQFAAGVAHELRNPLTAIRSTVQFLSDSFQEHSENKKLAAGLLDEVDRLNNIVEDLLSLARPAESNGQLLDISQEIERCLHLIEVQAKNQNVRLQQECDANLPPIVFDSGELRQLFLNILVNSIQAMPEGGTLTIKVLPYVIHKDESDPEIRKILIEIQDQGPGIPKELMEKVFEPFFTTKAEGTGLGLAICNCIIKRYQGDIWIDETDYGGTTVKIVLPIGQKVENEVITDE